MKFEIEQVVSAMKEANAPNEAIDASIEKLQELAAELQKEKEANRVKRAKKKLVLLHVEDTASYYVMQAEIDDDLSQTIPRLQKSIGDYNAKAKKKKVEIKNFADAIEFIPAKILKENGLVIKTKQACDIKELPRKTGGAA